MNWNVRNAEECGCGNGTFPILAAKTISRELFAFDIEPEMISVAKSEASEHGVENMEVILRDFIADGMGL